MAVHQVLVPARPRSWGLGEESIAALPVEGLGQQPAQCRFVVSVGGQQRLAFLPEQVGRPNQFQLSSFDGHGATLSAIRRDSVHYPALFRHRNSTGYSIAVKAWNDGCRTPHLADLLASMTVLDGVGLDNRRNTDPKVHLRAALAVIDTCLAAHVGESGSILRRLERRRERLNVQLAASPRAQVEKPRNLRPARTSSPGMAPLQAGSQSKS